MSVMIVGADRLGGIEKNLAAQGFHVAAHVCGRSAADHRCVPIPRAATLVVVLVDYVNHVTARNIKKQAKIQGVPLVFARRSWRSLTEQLQRRGVT